MGIPLYFKTISNKYPDIIIDIDNIDNVNGLFLDLNCAIHPCCRKIIADGYKVSKKNQFEKRMIHEVLNYIDKLVALINPSIVFIAIDGVAPAAKMQQQRLRRFKSFLERKETNKIKDRFGEPYNKEFWDTNAISPGTEFMQKLSEYILNHIKIHELYKPLDVIFSNASEPGEGEHKIFNFIKNSNIQGNNVVYGLDADLIMLSISSRKNNIYLLREAIEFGNKVNMDRFLYLNIDELKENLSNELLEKYVLLNKVTITDRNIIDGFSYDYVFICYLLGNDFLPHLASVSLKNDGLEQILDIYMQTYYTLNKHLIDSDKFKINTAFLKQFIGKLSEFEYDNIKLEFYQRNKFNIKHKKYENELMKHLDFLNNYPMFNRKDELKIDIENKGWKKRYYYTCFGVTEQHEIDSICHNYFEGLKWTLEYYFKECASWQWKYNFRHGPLLCDLLNYLNKLNDINKIKINKAQANSPIVQLLTILPPDSKSLLPISAQELMKSSESPLIDIYPESYKLDTIFKRYYWQCTPILPSVDYKLVKDVIKDLKFNKEEKKRFSKETAMYKKANNSIKVI